MPNYNTSDDKHEQAELISEPRAEYNITPEAQAEKETYRQRLAEHLKDPAFRAIEGFPLGTDEAILALSDPPYYTACPNPFLGEIVERWRDERRALRKAKDLPDDESQLVLTHTRQPFAADVSEGKNDPIYNAHSYHTKVPHKAIMRYILHYTDPGDIVLDGFCGTGMTGVAAQLCGDKKAVESLGFTVKDGRVSVTDGKVVSSLGARKAVLVDLSPAATFIAYNYNTPVDARAFEREAKRILKEVEKECGWMYETRHTDGSIGKINYTVWSDVFLCPQCAEEMIFWDVAIDHKKDEVLDNWNCPHCNVLLAKSPKKESGAQKADRAWEVIYDRFIRKSIKRIKQVPVLIHYSAYNKRFQKQPDPYDLQLISQITDLEMQIDLPVIPLPEGDKTSDPKNAGISYLHHFYTKRNLISLHSAINKAYGSRSLFVITALMRSMSKMFRWAPHGKHTAGMSGTLYIPSISHEYTISDGFKRRLLAYEELVKILEHFSNNCIISNGNAAAKIIPENSIDYIFVDPPFGDNLMYSELNFIWESWLKISTNNINEAIINKSQHKGLLEYQQIIEKCFENFFRILKSGRWMTVEFHNSQNSVWNSIHEAITQAGFVVADVRTLDKKQGNFNQTNAAGAVKQDLVISAYKTTAVFEQKFREQGGSVQGAWEFLRQHLENLPLPNLKDGIIESVQERLPYLLYDRMVAFHIQRGMNVPLSAPEFYQGLTQRFLERESMVFNPAQAAAYDKLRLQAERVAQLALFITDETSARQWIHQELEPASGHGPQTYGELQPRFIQQLHKSKYEALPELKVLLEQSFLEDPAGRWYNPDPEKQADLEALRQKALLREFQDYRRSKGRLKIFRSEAILAGFSHAWRERQYDVIVEIAERMPESVLQESQQLLMYYHNASLRHAQGPKQEKLI